MVPNSNRCHVGANRLYNAGTLVAQNNRENTLRIQTIQSVRVRVAYTRVKDLMQSDKTEQPFFSLF
jgi:hypothetical protein